MRYEQIFPEQKKLLPGKLQSASFADYEQALLDADILLPDGIALQIFYFFARLTRTIKYAWAKNKFPFFLHNINGTDFIPYFLEELQRQYGNHKVCVLLYGAKAEVVEQTEKYLSSQGLNVVYAQDGYSTFRWHKAEEALAAYEHTINVFLIARSTSEVPIQELWSVEHQEKIQEHQLLTFTVGGLFDFWTGQQKRAPKLLRTMKLEWLWRLCLDPQRNKKKVQDSLMLFRYIFSHLLLKKR